MWRQGWWARGRVPGGYDGTGLYHWGGRGTVEPACVGNTHVPRIPCRMAHVRVLHVRALIRSDRPVRGDVG